MIIFEPTYWALFIAMEIIIDLLFIRTAIAVELLRLIIHVFGEQILLEILRNDTVVKFIPRFGFLTVS